MLMYLSKIDVEQTSDDIEDLTNQDSEFDYFKLSIFYNLNSALSVLCQYVVSES